jgi:hypothetical protein
MVFMNTFQILASPCGVEAEYQVAELVTNGPSHHSPTLFQALTAMIQ